MISYLSGMQMNLSSVTEASSGLSHGFYTCSYSAMPVINGQFSFSEENLSITAPSLFDGTLIFPVNHMLSSLKQTVLAPYSFDFSLYQPSTVIMPIQPEIYQLYQSFYHNRFELVSHHTLLELEASPCYCTVYQMHLCKEWSASLENILSIIQRSLPAPLLDSFQNTHPEWTILTNASLLSQATITLSIDSNHIIRQLQCQIPCKEQTYYYTMTLTGKEEPLSSYILSCACTDTATCQVQSYVKISKKESASYTILAQKADSRIVDSFLITATPEQGVLHEYAVIHYSYSRHNASVPDLAKLLFATDMDTDPKNAPICNGSIQYYVKNNPKEKEWELNIEALSLSIPKRDLTFVASMRYTQTASAEKNPVALPEPLYEMNHISGAELLQLQEEILHNALQSPILHMILSAMP